MDCHQAQELLSAYIDRELPSDRAQAVEGHVSSCPRCARELAELKALVAELHKLPMDHAPEDLCAGVMAQVQGRAGPADARRHKLLPLTAALLAAAAGLVVVLTSALLPRRPTPPPRRLARALPGRKEEHAELREEKGKAEVAVEMESALPETAQAPRVAQVRETMARKRSRKAIEKRDSPAERLDEGLALSDALRRRRAHVERAARAEAETLERDEKREVGAFGLGAPRAGHRDGAEAESQAPPAETHADARARLKRAAGAGAAKPARPSRSAGKKLAKGKKTDVRTITVLTNDPSRARVHIMKLVSDMERVSLQPKPKPGLGPIMVVLTQARYASLLKVLGTSGYELERDPADSAQPLFMRRPAGAHEVRTQPKGSPAGGQLEVTIRFRRVNAGVAPKGKK